MERTITNSISFNRKPQIRIASFYLACLLLFSYQLSSQSLQWAKSLSGTGGETGYGITVDGVGNVLTTGNFSGLVDFDPGPGTYTLNAPSDFDIFVSKLDPAGNFIWAKKVGASGPSGDRAKAIVTDAAGNVYVTGRFCGSGDFDPGPGVTTLNSGSLSTFDVFVLKLDASGNFVWAVKFGGTGSEIGNAIALDAAGNVIIAGTFAGTVDFDPGVATYTLASAGGNDVFINKLDPSGNFLWAKRMGGTTIDEANGLDVDSYGNILTVGSTHGGDYDPGPGVFTITNISGSTVVFISKLNSAGNFVWAKRIGASSTDEGNAIAVDALNNVYTTGKYAGTADFDPGVATYTLPTAGGGFVSKLDSLGNFVFAKSFNGSSSCYGHGIDVDAAQNVYTVGRFLYTTDFDPGAGTFTITSSGIGDVFISKLDATGNFVSAKVIGSTVDDAGYGMALDPAANVHITGFYGGVADFDPDAGVFNMTPVGTYGCFVVKLGASSTGISLIKEGQSFLVYPNPSNGKLYLETDELENYNIEVMNTLGQLIFQKDSQDNASGLDLSHLENGMYILNLRSGNVITSKKIVIQK